MIMKPIARVAVVRNLLWASVLCLAAGLLGGCCTVTCCDCDEVTRCASPQTRVLMVVENRVDTCPDIWMDKLKVRPKDRVKLVNCSGQEAMVKFTPPGFFDDGDTFTLADGATQTLTVSSTVIPNQLLDIEVKATAGPCSHGGSTIIVSDGP